MSALHVGEIVAGVVAFLSTGVIVTDRNTIATVPQRAYDDHFFLVFHHSGGDRYLITPLTTVYRSERLPIPREWRLAEAKEKRWLKGPMYLNDGASFYSVTTETLMLASLIDRDKPRKRLTPEGLMAVWQEIRAQEPRRLLGKNLF